MAYNPSLYSPYGQQPYTWGSPTWPYQTQTVASQPINGLVYVTGIEGAKAYQLPPNSSMPLFDGNEDVLYVKTTDSAGYPTIRTFSFHPMDPVEAKVVDDGYVQRSEFDALLAEVRALSEGMTRGVSDGE